MARYGAERALQSLPLMTTLTNGSGPGSSASSSPTPLASPLSPDSGSRIPRLSASPSPLRRSASMRLRGERLDHHRSSHQDFFPVITENATDSPKKCGGSLSLTPLRGRSARSRTNLGTSPGGGHGAGCSEDCSDAESIKSFGSNYSTASACDHASFALNGTTWSGRTRRYVVHCSSHQADSEEYLTPTQRAARQVRKFQALLREARKEIEEKDREIFRLTKEVVELRLYKASLNSPDEKTDSSEAATVRENCNDLNNPLSPESLPDELTTCTADSSFDAAATAPSCSPRRTPDKKESSLVDSGHFEDGSVHSKESVCLAANADIMPALPSTSRHDDSVTFMSESSMREVSFQDEERKRLVDHYESRIEEMHRRHVDEIQLLKENHNDKVESLLNQLAEVNTRYCEVRPSLDTAESRTRELEAEVEALRTELAEQKALLADQEERNKQMYLKMYSKGQEAARIEQADQPIVHEQAQKSTSKVSVAELLQQLTVTQAELENIKGEGRGDQIYESAEKVLYNFTYPPFQDTSYTPEPLALANRSQSLLSLQEAVSLWVLGTRKAMYRRIVESRNSQGALDPEITLQFLKSAIYYFLTDKENLHGHLNAIESILGFTDSEKLNIDRIYRSARK